MKVLTELVAEYAAAKARADALWEVPNEVFDEKAAGEAGCAEYDAKEAVLVKVLELHKEGLL